VSTEHSENPGFYISEEWDTIYSTLCRRGGSLSGYYIFEQMTGLFTLCASIGSLSNSKIQLVSRKEIFKWTSLDKEEEVPILTAITWDFLDKNNSILNDHKTISEVTCEFANGGAKYLLDNYFNEHMQEGKLINPEKMDIEFHLAMIIEGLRMEQEPL